MIPLKERVTDLNNAYNALHNMSQFLHDSTYEEICCDLGTYHHALLKEAGYDEDDNVTLEDLIKELP